MVKELNITIEEIDYCIEIDWNSGEFPVVGDYVRIIAICTDEQRKELESMTLPTYLHADFPNTIDYLKHYRWQVVERCWLSKNCLSINCRRVDPTLL